MKNLNREIWLWSSQLESWWSKILKLGTGNLANKIDLCIFFFVFLRIYIIGVSDVAPTFSSHVFLLLFLYSKYAACFPCYRKRKFNIYVVWYQYRSLINWELIQKLNQIHETKCVFAHTYYFYLKSFLWALSIHLKAAKFYHQHLTAVRERNCY